MSEAADDQQINLGMHVLNEPASHDPRTLIVLGLSRGGTSMVAGALAHMGVDMGDRIGPNNFEDIRLSGAIERGRLQVARKMIKERNNRSDVWAWKRPSAVRHLDVVATEFRNPYYLIVLRDPVAVSTRRQLSMGTDIIRSLEASIRNQAKIIKFAGTTQCPVLLLSYEKCIQRPRLTVETIAAFAGIEPTEEAVSFIQPDAPGYVASAAAQKQRRLEAEAAESAEVDGNRTRQRD